MSKTLIPLLILFTLTGCATKAPTQIGQCELSDKQASTLSDIKAMDQEIKDKTERFDKEMSKGPVDLYSNENYQEILELKSERDEAVNYLAESLSGNTLCLQTLFKKDLNFPELIDEK